MNKYEETYTRIKDTKDRRFLINPDYENAVRDIVKCI